MLLPRYIDVAECTAQLHTPEIRLVFEHFTLEARAWQSRALQEHCTGWTRRREPPQSAHQEMVALGCSDVLVW